MRRSVGSAVLAVLALAPCAALAQAQNAVQALVTMQDASGLFEGTSAAAPVATSEAIASLEVLAPGAPALENARFALFNLYPGAPDFLARRYAGICGDRLLGEDPTGRLLLATDGGLGATPGASAASPIETARLLSALGRCDPTNIGAIATAADRLVALQHLDGSFDIADENGGVLVTALAVEALARTAAFTGHGPATTSGAAYLLSRQALDGGFGSGSALESAFALSALVASGLSAESAVALGVGHLSALQAQDGSFGSALATAVAARALGATRPDLSVAPGIEVPVPLVAGEQGTIRATVKNSGPVSVDVAVALRSTSELTRNVVHVPAFGQVTTDLLLTPSATGTLALTVIADPDGVVDETDEGNNARALSAEVMTHASLGIVAATTSPSGPAPADSVTVHATVRNRGGRSTSTTVGVFAGATELAHASTTVAAVASVDVPVSIGTLSAGLHALTVRVDVTGLDDPDPSDDSRALNVDVRSRADLVVTPGLISFSQNPAPEGTTVQIRVGVRNGGTETAAATSVRVYEGAPATGTLLGTFTLASLAAGGTAEVGPVAYPTYQKPGFHPIYAVVDPDNLVDEKNEDNTAVATLEVQAEPDPAIQLADVSITPASPSEGDVATVQYTVRNLGSVLFPSPAGSVRAQVTTPDGKTLPIGTPLLATTWSLEPGQAITPQTASYRFQTSGIHVFRFVLVSRVDEARTDNDTLEVSVDVAAPSQPDLTIPAGEVRFDPAEPKVSSSASVQVRVRNRVGPSATTIVTAYDGDPIAANEIGHSTVSVASHSFTDVTIPWTPSTAGPRKVWAVVDPDNLVAETDETNNRASATAQVLMADDLAPSGLTVTAADPDFKLDFTEGSAADATTVRGYRIYRDGDWINPPADVSRTATVSSSTNGGTSAVASKAVDGIGSTAWLSAINDTAPTYTLDFGHDEPVQRAVIEFDAGHIPASLEVDVKVSGAWQQATTIASNTSRVVDLSFTPVTGSAVKYVFPAQASGITETAVFASRLIKSGDKDTGIFAGTRAYAVRAESPGGAISAASNTASGSLGDTTAPSAPTTVTATRTNRNVSVTWTAVTAADLAGYRVYRNLVSASQVDHFAVVTSSTGVGDTVFGSGGSVLTSNGDGGSAVARLDGQKTIDAIELVLGGANTFYYAIDSSLDGIRWTTIDDELAGRDGGARALKVLDTPVDARYLRIRDARATDGGFTAGQLRAYVSDSLPIRGSSLNGSWTVKTLNPLELMDITGTTSNALTRPAFRSLDLTDSLVRVTAGAAGALVESFLGPTDARVFPQRGNKNVRQVYRADASTVNLQASFYAVGLDTGTSKSETIELEGTYKYKVVAVDTSGNESAPTAAADVVYAESTPPAPTLTATAGDRVIHLSWSIPGTGTYEQDGNQVFLQGSTDPIATVLPNSYDVTGVVNRTQYCYQVAVRTVNGKLGTKSAAACATPSADDLTIAAAFGGPAIFASPSLPVLGDSTTLYASVGNLGPDAVTGAKVRLYDGDPAAAGTTIGTVTVDIDAGASRMVSVPWTPSTAGVHNVFATVDPDHALAETNETNNQASVPVAVLAASQLQITVADLDPVAFPDVAAHLLVRDDLGTPATGLLLQDFDAVENGTAAELLSLQPGAGAGGVAQVDLAFVFDTSGSMADESTEVCALMGEIATRVALQGVDVQPTFYGLKSEEFVGVTMPDCLVPLDQGIFQGQAIAVGHEDWGPGTTWVAAHHPWRTGASRIVIPMSDEGPYQGNPIEPDDNASIEEAVTACVNNSVVAYPLYSEISPGIVAQDLIASMTRLATGTGGKGTAFTTGAGLSDLLVGRILRAAADYVLTFSTPSPARDGSTRNVVIDSSWRGVSGSGSGSYLAPLDPLADAAFLADVGAALAVSPANPSPGDTVTLSSSIRNLGGASASPVTVRFYQGDPDLGGVQIGRDQLVTLSPGGTGLATAEWTATPGAHLLFVVLDPDGLIPESDESNNRASAAVVVPGTAQGDLLLGEASISVTPASPRTGQTVTATARVHAEGGAFSDVPVSFFAGEPGNGGKFLAAASIPFVDDGETQPAMASFAAPAPGSVEIWAVIDPTAVLSEATRANDRAYKVLDVQGAGVTVAFSTDQPSVAPGTNVLGRVNLVNESGASVAGNAQIELSNDQGKHLLATVAIDPLASRAAPGYRFQIPVSVTATPAAKDALGIAHVDFAAQLSALGDAGTFDPDSIRVFEKDALGSVLGERPSTFTPDAQGATHGDVVFSAPGATGAAPRSFLILFDTTDHAPFAVANRDLPPSDAVIFWSENRNAYAIQQKWDGTQGTRLTLRTPPAGGGAPYPLGGTIGDFDGDSFPDVVAAYVGEVYYTYRPRFTGDTLSFADAVVGPAESQGPVDGAVPFQNFGAFDFNGDGHLDFINFDTRPTVGYGRGDGTFSLAPYTLQYSGPQQFYFSGEFAVRDIDGDGRPDLLNRYSSNILLRKGQPGGGFGVPTQVTNLPSGVVGGEFFAVADFDEDGHDDLVLSADFTPTYPRFVKGNGNGTFQNAVSITGLQPYPFCNVQAADLNGDGHMDIVTMQSHWVYWLQGNGDGTFQAAQQMINSPLEVRRVFVASARRRLAATTSPAEPGPGTGYDVTLPTTGLPAGSYTLTATVALDGGAIATGQVALTILPVLSPQLSVITREADYGSSDPVTLRARIQTPGANVPLEGVLTLTVTTPDQAQLYQSVQNVGPLPPGELLDVNDTFFLNVADAGLYSVSAELRDLGGAPLASASGPMVVRGDTEAGSILSELTLPASVNQGEPLDYHVWLEADGNSDFVGSNVEVKLLALSSGLPVLTDSNVRDLRRVAPVTVDGSFDTTSLQGVAYLAVVFVNGEPLTSQHVNVNVLPPTTDLPTARTEICADEQSWAFRGASILREPGVAMGTVFASSGEFSFGDTSVVDGDIYIDDNLRGGQMGRVEGTATVSGLFMLQDDAFVGNEAVLNGTIEPCACGFDIQAASADVALNNDNALLDGFPGWDGNSLILDNQSVTLPAGRFYISWMGLDNGSTIVPPAEGVAELFVTHSWADGGSTVGDPARPNAIHVASRALGSVGESFYLTEASKFYGHLVEPLSTAHIFDIGTEFHGTIITQKLDLDDGATVYVPAHVVGLPVCQ